MNDLEELFTSVDSFKEDLMDFGVAGLSAIGANLIWGYIDDGLVSKLPVVGASNTGRAALAILAGVAGGAALAKTNKNVATGVAVGLVARGLTGLLKQVAPTLPLQGLGYGNAARTLRGAAVQIEERTLLGGATTQIVQRAQMAQQQRQMAGLSAAGTLTA